MSDNLFKSKGDKLIFLCLGLPIAVMLWTGALALVLKVIRHD